MVTDFELRILSELSYINHLAKEFNLGENQTIASLPKTKMRLIKQIPKNKREETKKIIENWTILETYRRANNTQINSELDAYLFCKNDGSYVIVFRGTNPSSPKQLWHDMRENLHIFNQSQVGDEKSQFWQSLAFTIGCIKVFNIPEDSLILTGHSKGGALASKVGHFMALAMKKKLKTITFAPARMELWYAQYTDYPTPSIDCKNYIIEGDLVIGSLTRYRFVIFLMMFNKARIRDKKISHLSKKGFFVSWEMWILRPYIGSMEIIKPTSKNLLRHSLGVFDDHFNPKGMLK